MTDRYSDTHGPRAGSRVRLGDTGLVVRVERDSQRQGDEFVPGMARTARDGMHLAAVTTRESCDLVVSNAVIIDPLLGVRKASIGVRDGRIVGVGRAGNPNTLDRVDVVVGTGTTIIPGEGLIATPGAIDTHVHLLAPRVAEAALASGVTTILSQNAGTEWGSGLNASALLQVAFDAMDEWPINVGFLGRGSSSRPDPLVEAIEAGACGLKVHEDFGANPRALDTALSVADDFDVQVALHADTLNESGSAADTLAVIGGRTIHAFHVEGCGGGHAPNVLQLAGVPNVIGSSTNPTLPFGRDAVVEHARMIAAVHKLDLGSSDDERIAQDRVRSTTMGAENVLHDLGVIPITSSDAQAMGRAGETIRRTFALAAVMRARMGKSPGDDDNERVLRYLAKLTVNPAIAHGIAHEVGRIAPSLLADIVLWRPELFGVKPELVLKGGFPAWGAVGDPNASIRLAQPVVLGPQFGACGIAPTDVAVSFVSEAAVAVVAPRSRRRCVGVRGTRGIGLATMVRNTTTGDVRVDPASGSVTFDGEPIRCDAVDAVPLSRLYLL